MVLQDNNLNKELFLKINVVGGLIFLVISAYSFSFLVYVMTKESTKLFSEFNYFIFRIGYGREVK